MYIAKRVIAGEYVLIKKYSPRLFGAPGHRRCKKQKGTPKAMEKYNNRSRAEKLQMLMILNFDRGFHITLDYPKGNRPETYEQAEKNLTKCLHKVSRRLKRKGKQFKYIAVTERGKRAAALHHHLVIEGSSDILEELISVWGNHMKISTMYEEGAYKDLAEYFCKVETKEEKIKGKSKYHRSRNLKEPVTQLFFVRGSIEKDPQVPKGFHIVPESLTNGFNEFSNIRYQSYMLKRAAEPEHTSEPKGNGEQKGKVKKLFDKIKRIFKRRPHG